MQEASSAARSRPCSERRSAAFFSASEVARGARTAACEAGFVGTGRPTAVENNWRCSASDEAGAPRQTLLPLTNGSKRANLHPVPSLQLIHTHVVLADQWPGLRRWRIVHGTACDRVARETFSDRRTCSLRSKPTMSRFTRRFTPDDISVGRVPAWYFAALANDETIKLELLVLLPSPRTRLAQNTQNVAVSKPGKHRRHLVCMLERV